MINERSGDGGSGGGMRWAAVDAAYPAGGGGVGAVVVADSSSFARIVEEHVARVAAVPPYRPGLFFERELPVLRAALATTEAVALVVVDGYVDLDPAGRPGLGAHLHAAIGVPVVGVAKTAFRSATHALPVRRGSGARPLFVTAAGIPVADAAALVAGMAGDHRIPDALRRVDRLARQAAAAA